MATEKPTRRNLNSLLNSLENAHKKDVHDYSSGYLNETKLYKLPRDFDNATWKSAQKSIPKLLPKMDLPTKKTDIEKDIAVKETFRNFSLGTTGIVPPPSRRSTKREGTRAPVEVERNISISSQGSYGKLDDGVLVENMGASETMVASQQIDKPITWAEHDFLEEGYSRPFSQAALKDQNLAKMKHRFIPNHMNVVTKKDQFKRLKEFEENVLQKGDMLEQNVMSGVKAVEHLEARLRRDLDSLQYHGYGPNFHRLQVYSNTFEDLIDESPTFKYILGTIKKEYDDYISSLLDQQPSRHRLLYEQVEQLSSRGTSNPQVLNDEQQRLSTLEAVASQMLDENERLRKELQEEQLAAEDHTEQEEEGKDDNVDHAEPALDLADKIEEAHATILEKLDQLKELRQTLRSEFVPSSVVTHLEQCIKETEVESQRYQSQKEYFERSCAEMEKELKDAIESADTTEKDSKRIWKKVNAIKKGGDHDSDDGEDDAKWNWYIS